MLDLEERRRKKKNIKDQKLKGVDDVRQSSTLFETWGCAGTIYLLNLFKLIELIAGRKYCGPQQKG